MSSGIGLRRALTVGVSALAVLAIACAEKTLAPEVALSPRFTIRVTATASRSAVAQKLWIIAGYFRPPFPGDAPDDSLYGLSASLADITGGPQQVSINVDLTVCLADPSRHGSLTACSLYIGAFLEPSTFDPDTSAWFGSAYDYRLAGPFDATPGHPPTVPAIDLSNSAFTVNRWEGDQSLQLGGELVPEGLTGPITGASGASGGATLFALTGGTHATSTTPNGPRYGPSLGVFQNGSWRRVDGPSVTGPTDFSSFTDVAAFAPNDAYLTAASTGATAGLYHYDGTTITAVTGSGFAHPSLRSVAVSNATPNARYLVAGDYNGGVWVGTLPNSFQKYSLAGLTVIDGVCINGGTEAFATSRTNNSPIYRFDGTTWTQVSSPNTFGKADLQCLGPGQVYVAAGGSLHRWNGGGWTQVPGPPGTNVRNMTWGVASATEMYAIGDSASTNRAFYRFDGTSWREVGRLTYANAFAGSRIWADPKGSSAYVSPAFNGQTTRIERVTPTSVSVLAYNPELRDVALPTPTSAFVVGRNFFLGRWNGAQWSVDAAPAGTRANRVLNGVWASDPANVWVVGQFSTIVRWDGARWSVLSDSIRPIVPGVDNYNAVWGTGGSVWTVGDASIVRCANTTTCTVTSSGGALYGVWGTSTSNIYAVGAGGRILHFDGTSWTAMSSATGAKLARVSGSSANDVWAAGDTVLLHFDGTTWKNVTSTVSNNRPYADYQSPVSNGIPLEVALWAPNPYEVYYGSWELGVTRGSGAFWGATTLAMPELPLVNAISGVARGCALAITDASNRNGGGGGPRLLRGVGAAGCLSTPMSPPTSWP